MVLNVQVQSEWMRRHNEKDSVEESWAETGSVKAKKDACQRCFSWHRSKSSLCDKREIGEEWDNAQLDHAVHLTGARDRLEFFCWGGEKEVVINLKNFFPLLPPQYLKQNPT